MGPLGPAAMTAGGRGGEIVRVTSLESDGPGTLRAALEADGPKIIVFEVGGVIDLDGNNLRVS
ncbi:MAG TPA: pectate lyase, partial [Hyphomonas sp.]|nr:pectate lyase [Hyphomonas sp.]